MSEAESVPLSRSPSASEVGEHGDDDVSDLVSILESCFAKQIADNKYHKRADPLISLEETAEGVVRCTLDCLETPENEMLLDKTVTTFGTAVPRTNKWRKALEQMDSDREWKLSNLQERAAQKSWRTAEAEKIHYFLDYGVRLLAKDRFSKSVKLHALRLCHRDVFAKRETPKKAQCETAAPSTDDDELPATQPRKSASSEDMTEWLKEIGESGEAGDMSSQESVSTDNEKEEDEEKEKEQETEAEEEKEQETVTEKEKEHETEAEDGFLTPNAAATQHIIGLSDDAAEDSEEEEDDGWTVASDTDELEICAAEAYPLAEKPSAAAPLAENDERHIPEYLHMAVATEFDDDFMPDTEGAKSRRRIASCAARKQAKAKSAPLPPPPTPPSPPAAIAPPQATRKGKKKKAADKAADKSTAMTKPQTDPPPVATLSESQPLAAKKKKAALATPSESQPLAAKKQKADEATPSESPALAAKKKKADEATPPKSQPPAAKKKKRLRRHRPLRCRNSRFATETTLRVIDASAATSSFRSFARFLDASRQTKTSSWR